MRWFAGALLWLALAAVLGGGGALWYLASRSSEAEPPPSLPAKDALEVATAAPIKLAWDRSPSPRAVGYRVMYGTSSGQYVDFLEAGNATTATLTGLRQGTRYFIVVVALDARGRQSPPSNEVTLVAR